MQPEAFIASQTADTLFFSWTLGLEVGKSRNANMVVDRVHMGGYGTSPWVYIGLCGYMEGIAGWINRHIVALN